MWDHYHIVRGPGSPDLGINSFSNALVTSAAVSVLAGKVLSTQKTCPLAPRDTCNCSMLSVWQWNQSASLLQDISLSSEWALFGGSWGRSGVNGCSLHRWGMSQLLDWLYFSCQELPWPKLTTYIGLPSCSEFLDELSWWLDKLQFGERSIAHVHQPAIHGFLNLYWSPVFGLCPVLPLCRLGNNWMHQAFRYEGYLPSYWL